MLKKIKIPLLFPLLKASDINQSYPELIDKAQDRLNRRIGTEGFTKIKKIIFFIFFALTVLSLSAQTLEYYVQKPKPLFVGTPFHVLVDIQTSLQDSIFAPVIDTLDVFILRELKSEDIVENDSITTKIDMTFQAFDTGEYTFPELEYSVKSGEEITVLKTNEFLVNVQSMLADSSNVVQDIADPIKVNLGFWDYALPILIILILILGIYLLIKYLKARKQEDVKPIIIDDRPDWQIVLEELQKLRSEKLLEKGDFLIFHFRLSYLLRLFIELHYKVFAVEMTTSEIRENLTQIDPEEKSEVLKFLSFADRIKFAKFIPSTEESDKALNWLESYLLKFKEISEQSDQEEANA
ncbi:MAG: hypothetical protein K9N09_05845 [Candidatus Cloacimonetes bacterium]|nr:hypothetical protein [Candidatus Cloacimonadota bacterium]MCF7813574.1 hypothetical protein [Candidatus Cloacimonadota bacterium]MCF7868205.1 hypothetical protein [Candidatus Cloacimonadota bacterium]MCF7883631.1 hypothetical protein [Candidatus Cloacimonadota bacterium]